jgi:hypothetical protein
MIIVDVSSDSESGSCCPRKWTFLPRVTICTDATTYPINQIDFIPGGYSKEGSIDGMMVDSDASDFVLDMFINFCSIF